MGRFRWFGNGRAICRSWCKSLIRHGVFPAIMDRIFPVVKCCLRYYRKEGLLTLVFTDINSQQTIHTPQQTTRLTELSLRGSCIKVQPCMASLKAHRDTPDYIVRKGVSFRAGLGRPACSSCDVAFGVDGDRCGATNIARLCA